MKKRNKNIRSPLFYFSIIFYVNSIFDIAINHTAFNRMLCDSVCNAVCNASTLEANCTVSII